MLIPWQSLNAFSEPCLNKTLELVEANNNGLPILRIKSDWPFLRRFKPQTYNGVELKEIEDNARDELAICACLC